MLVSKEHLPSDCSCPWFLDLGVSLPLKVGDKPDSKVKSKWKIKFKQGALQ